ncbi:hypothetical protein [Vibrio harveyi]|uniref:hypothetical protein n=1 Tax=Vibrio harveyi TaxID=669 RepID=UPI0018F12DAB|nr:hypothetical protein [Vibrio harveyi]
MAKARFTLVGVKEDNSLEWLFQGTKKECEEQRDEIFAPIFGGEYRVMKTSKYEQQG